MSPKIWNEDRNTVLYWIIVHKGFSVTDDSSLTNKQISRGLGNVNSSSLDMMARHIKAHLFRIDLYGSSSRGSKNLKELVDRYRTDMRELRNDANMIAKLNGWYDDLKDFL
tara:strand:- start:730 stop:1062 length:333 start_codon:yes stop_codon:yes gene_type:complete